jgi:hypothetical protein
MKGKRMADNGLNRWTKINLRIICFFLIQGFGLEYLIASTTDFFRENKLLSCD